MPYKAALRCISDVNNFVLEILREKGPDAGGNLKNVSDACFLKGL